MPRPISTDDQGHAARPGPLIELQGPSDRITHAGAIQISRFGPPPNLRFLANFPYIFQFEYMILLGFSRAFRWKGLEARLFKVLGPR